MSFYAPSTRQNPSLPRRAAAKTKVIAQPEVPASSPPGQMEGMDDSDYYFDGIYTPPPPGGWPGGTPPWKMGAMPTSIPPSPSFGTTAFRPGGRSPSGGSGTVIPTSLAPTIIPPGVAGVKTSTMMAPTSSTYTSAYPLAPPGF